MNKQCGFLMLIEMGIWATGRNLIPENARLKI
jgi:hypothetical protein